MWNEDDLIEEALNFPDYKFLDRGGSLSRRKIALIDKKYRQDALNAYFIKKSLKYHPVGLYKYKFSNYTSDKTLIKIWCTEHGGFFETLAGNHTKGYGCPICANKIFTRVTPVGEFRVAGKFNRYTIKKDEIVFYYINCTGRIEQSIPLNKET